MLRSLVLSFLVLITGCSTDAVKEGQDKCNAEYMAAYDLHNDAIRYARDGKCLESANRIMSVAGEMAYLSEVEYCNSTYRQGALDGYFRAVHDAKVINQKFCPDTKIVLPVKK